MSSLSAPLRQLLQQAHQARLEGRVAAAQACCQRVLQQQPEQPDALLMLAELAQAAGDLPAAEQCLARALRASPGHVPSWLRLGSLHEDLGRIAEAEAAWRRAGELMPSLPQAPYNQARLLRALGQHQAAGQALGRVLGLPALTPELRAQALQLQALLHEDAGRLDLALQALDQALQAAPQRAALHHNRGVLLQRQAQPAAALAAHDRAMALGLDAAEAHYNRGNSLQSLGRYAEALAAYRRALQRDPQYALALYDCARLRWRLGHDDFMAELEAAAAAAPASPVPPGIRGRLLLRAERHAEAATAFTQAERLGSAAGYSDGLGQALCQLGRLDEALAAHRRAVALAPQLAASHIGLAGCLLQCGQGAQAVQAAETAVQIAPLDQQAWALLGLAWRATGDPRADWLSDYRRHVQVYDLPPPEGWADQAGFNHALAVALEQMHTDVREPIDQTLRHGSQTLGDIFEQDHPLLVPLRHAIAQALDSYLDHLATLAADASHPLLSRLPATAGARAAPRWRFADSWSSRLRRGGFHTHHVHPHGWISSCYYVALPPSVVQADGSGAADAGCIAFGMPDIAGPGLPTRPQRVVQPRVGSLVLFPSYLWHGTLPFDDEQPRLTVAFDVLPTG